MSISPLVPIGVALVALVVNAIVKIELKYAPTKKDAYRGVRKAVLIVADVVIVGWLSVSMVQEILKPTPPTRMSVLIIALGVTVISYYVLAYLLLAVMKLITKMVSAQVSMVSAQDSHIRLTGKIVEALKGKPKDSGPK